MAGVSKGGQRSNTTSASGRKERSPTRTPHAGSRSDPSHAVEKARGERAKKAAGAKKAVAARAAAGKARAKKKAGGKR